MKAVVVVARDVLGGALIIRLLAMRLTPELSEAALRPLIKLQHNERPTSASCSTMRDKHQQA